MKENSPDQAAADQQDRGASIQAWNDPFRLFLIQHIGNIAGGRHVEYTGGSERGQKTIGEHTVQQLSVMPGHTGKLRQKGDADEQHHAKDHGTRTDQACVAVSAAHAEQPPF